MAARIVDYLLSIPKENTYNMGCCTTDAPIHKYEYTWTINDFTFMQKCRQLSSSIFWIGVKKDTKCCLTLFTHGRRPIDKDFISIAVELVSQEQHLYNYDVICSILNAEKEKFKISHLEPEALSSNPLNKAWMCDRFCQRYFLFNIANGVLPDNKLTIFCEIIVYGRISNIVRQPNIVQLKKPDYILRENFENILLNEKFCDVTFAIGGRELRAHKLVLALRSDVFAAMFEHKMEENILNRVVIADVDYEVFKEMLNFIYSGKASNLDEMAYDLFAAADKYNLKTLKEMCEKNLSDKLSVETAVETLILADRHLAEQLKARAIDFIIIHIDVVSKTEAWQKMTVIYPHLISDIIRPAAQNQSH